MKLVVALIAAVAAASWASPADARTPGTDGRIAYNVALPDGGADVYTAAADGSDAQQVPLPYPNEDFAHATWSPDGSRLLLGPIRFDANGELLPFRPATVRPDGSDYTLLPVPGDPDDVFCTAWSPDGSRILCGLGLDQPGLFSLRSTDGGDAVRITSSPAGHRDASADYSPDGSQIAFVRHRHLPTGVDWRDDQAALFVVGADGSGLRQLTPFGYVRAHEQESVSWSPDGRRILTTTTDGRLFTISPNGAAIQPIRLDLGTGHYFAFGGRFSPDGSRIVFAMGVSGPSDIYTANLDGTDVHRLTADPAPDRFPDWAAASS